MPKVMINSKPFWTAGDSPIISELIEQLSPPTRDVGTAQRKDNRLLTRAPVRRYYQGIGWSRKDRDTGRGVFGLLDANAETRWRMTTIGLLHSSVTHVSEADHLIMGLNFKGDYWGFFEEDASASEVTTVNCRKYGSASADFTGGGQIFDSPAGTVYASELEEGARFWDAVVHKGRIEVVGNGGDDDASQEQKYKRAYSTDGASFTVATGTNWPTVQNYVPTAITRVNDWSDDMAKLCDFGDVLLAALYAHPDGGQSPHTQIQVYYSTNQGSAWTAGAVIPSGDGPKAFKRWKDPLQTPTADGVVLVTQEGIYRVDTAGTTYDLLHLLDGDPNSGRRAEVGQDGALWVPLGTGGILRLDYDAAGNKDVRIIWPGDGLVTERQGYAHWLSAPSLRWMFVAYGGQAASKQASIFAIDYEPQQDPETGKLYHPWHSVYLEGDANIDLNFIGFTAEDDADFKMIFALENASSSEVYQIVGVDKDPHTGVALTYQATGYLREPPDDLGDPHSSSNLMVSRLHAENLGTGITTGDNYVTENYGVDGAADTTVDLGDFTSTVLSLSHGTNGIGVEAKTVARRYILTRQTGDSSQTPQIFELELDWENVPSNLRRFSIPISLSLTKAGRPRATIKSIMEDINALLNPQVTLFPLEVDGVEGIRYVRAVPPSGRRWGSAQGDMPSGGNSAGVIELILEERI